MFDSRIEVSLASSLLSLTLALVASAASATTVPFTEDFDSDVAGWEDSVNAPLAFVASGSHDGSSYAQAGFNYFGYSSPFGGGPVVFRASASDLPSGGALIGDWLADGVATVSAWVRHDAPEALSFFLRVASSFNFPGAVIAGTTVVAPNTWTQVTFAIDPNSPLCIPETGTCAAALANVGNVQFGTDAPAGLVDDDAVYTFAIDDVALAPVPEPGTAMLLSIGLAGLWLRGRKTSAQR